MLVRYYYPNGLVRILIFTKNKLTCIEYLRLKSVEVLEVR
jgi:hypothetical protein